MTHILAALYYVLTLYKEYSKKSRAIVRVACGVCMCSSYYILKNINFISASHQRNIDISNLYARK